jgi:hypothetical protein
LVIALLTIRVSHYIVPIALDFNLLKATLHASPALLPVGDLPNNYQFHQPQANDISIKFGGNAVFHITVNVTSPPAAPPSDGRSVNQWAPIQ